MDIRRVNLQCMSKTRYENLTVESGIECVPVFVSIALERYHMVHLIKITANAKNILPKAFVIVIVYCSHYEVETFFFRIQYVSTAFAITSVAVNSTKFPYNPNL